MEGRDVPLDQCSAGDLLTLFVRMDGCVAARCVNVTDQSESRRDAMLKA